MTQDMNSAAIGWGIFLMVLFIFSLIIEKAIRQNDEMESVECALFKISTSSIGTYLLLIGLFNPTM